MTSGPLSRCGPIRQCAYLVRDLDEAVAWWAALGVGPFLSMPEARMQGYRLRGESVEPVLTLAFANSGDLQIELIATHDDVPSVFTEALGAGRDGAHHLAWWVDDWPGWERRAGAEGWTPVTDGDGGGMARFAYYDVGGPLLAEVMELNDATRWSPPCAPRTTPGTAPLPCETCSEDPEEPEDPTTRRPEDPRSTRWRRRWSTDTWAVRASR